MIRKGGQRKLEGDLQLKEKEGADMLSDKC